ncbi:MAG: hypothetical protein KKD63_00030, partial [Proteobacteria bacterium]|nr:hypothetical protein [Pseudomonadota bacterium]
MASNRVNGTMTFANSSKYTGSFINDLMENQGTLSYPDGQFYTGQFKNGKFHGAGTFRYLHATFTGNFIEGKKEGQGVL